MMRGLETIQSHKYLKKKAVEEQEYQELSEKALGDTRNKSEPMDRYWGKADLSSK